MAATAPNTAPQKGPPPPGQPPRRLGPQREDGTRHIRSDEDREAEVRSVRKVLQAAGVFRPEEHARRLVELCELDDGADYAPATIAWQGSATGARDQMARLRERLQEIRTLRSQLAQRSQIERPRVGDLDTLWARRVRRDHPEQFRQLDRDETQARERLAEARVRGASKDEISGLQTAVDVTTHQTRRAELALRRGEGWDLFQKAHKLAPELLGELDRLEQTALPAEEASLTRAVRASHEHAPAPHARPDPHPEPELAHAAPQMRM